MGEGERVAVVVAVAAADVGAVAGIVADADVVVVVADVADVAGGDDHPR